MSFHDYLRWLKRLELLLLLVAVVLIAFGPKLLGIALTFAIVVAMRRFYRCPHCGYNIDPRIPVEELTYCSSCGKALTGPVKPE